MGYAPRIDYLRVYGCGAYVFIPKARRTNKQAPRGELMTFLGIAPGEKGWIFMNSKNATIVAAHAVFDEKLFPRCKPSVVVETRRIMHFLWNRDNDDDGDHYHPDKDGPSHRPDYY